MMRFALRTGRLHSRTTACCALAAAVLVLLAGPEPARAQAPADSLDAAWVAVCANPPAGSLFESRCNEILNAGPGGAGRRSSAASGNNLGLTSAQGRASSSAAAAAKLGVEERLQELKDDEGGGGGGEWADGRLSLFFSGDFEDQDRKTSDFETGYEATNGGITVGADYRLSDRIVLGLAVSYGQGYSEFDGNSGDLDTDSLTFTGFASFAPTDALYLDAYAGYGQLDFDSTRRLSYTLNTGVIINGLASGETDADQFIAGASAGYDFFFGAGSIGPQAKIDFSSTDIDGYSETGGNGLALRYDDQTIDTLQTSLGISATYSMSTDFGVLVPQLRIDYVHEFDDDSRTINSSFAADPNGAPIVINTESPDRNFVRSGVSLTLIMPDGTIPFIDYERLDGHSFLDQQILSIGLRKEF